MADLKAPFPDHNHAPVGNMEIPFPVLLVEDHELNRFVVQEMLSSLGFVADTAEDGDIAVKMARKTQYSAILMDIEMPELDGFSAAKAIRQHEREYGHIPAKIIGMTGHTTKGIKVLCTAAGMDEFLLKPFTPAQLQEKLETIWRGGKRSELA